MKKHLRKSHQSWQNCKWELIRDKVDKGLIKRAYVFMAQTRISVNIYKYTNAYKTQTSQYTSKEAKAGIKGNAELRKHSKSEAGRWLSWSSAQTHLPRNGATHSGTWGPNPRSSPTPVLKACRAVTPGLGNGGGGRWIPGAIDQSA